jgi:hypothetical protein
MKTIQQIIYALIFVVFSCNSPESSEKSVSGDATSPLLAVVQVDQIIENPDAFIDQKVKVEGMVTHVCRHSGKRLHLNSKSTNKMIRVEAAEGINQFERELEGSDIVVEGIFHRQIIDEDYLAKWENEGMEGEGVHIEHSSTESEAKEEQIRNMRKQLQESGQDQLVSLWIDGNRFEVK